MPIDLTATPKPTSQRQAKPRGALTDTSVSLAKPREAPYKLTDGNGLYLLVNPTGSKLWRFKYRIDGVKDGKAKRKEKLMTLGAYPDVALAQAGDARDADRRQLALNTDPMVERKADTHAKAKHQPIHSKPLHACGGQLGHLREANNSRPSDATFRG